MADISIKGHSPILRHGYKKGGSVYHTTKEGKKARKGLWYNIHQKRKRGEKMRAKGAKGAPTEKAIKSEYGGVKLSNPSYEKYYKGMI